MNITVLDMRLLIFAGLFFITSQFASAQSGGRLTYISGAPIPNADSVAITTLYYAPCGGFVSGCLEPFVPIYDGNSMVMTQFTSSTTDAIGLSLALNSSAQLAGNLYDVFIGSNDGVLTLCTGPAWVTSTPGSSSPGAGPGTTQRQLFLGVQTNVFSITCKFGSSSFICPSNQCTYVGTIYATANGQTSVQIHPPAQPGGSNSIIGLCNAYNRVHVIAKEQDSTPLWDYSSSTVRDINNSNRNRIGWVDCFGTVQVKATYTVSSAPKYPPAPTAATVGICYNVDCTTGGFSGGAGHGASFSQMASGSNVVGGIVIGTYSPYPVLGLNFIQAGEQTTPQTITFFGDDFMQLTLDFEF